MGLRHPVPTYIPNNYTIVQCGCVLTLLKKSARCESIGSFMRCKHCNTMWAICHNMMCWFLTVQLAADNVLTRQQIFFSFFQNNKTTIPFFVVLFTFHKAAKSIILLRASWKEGKGVESSWLIAMLADCTAIVTQMTARWSFHIPHTMKSKNWQNIHYKNSKLSKISTSYSSRCIYYKWKKFSKISTMVVSYSIHYEIKIVKTYTIKIQNCQKSARHIAHVAYTIQRKFSKISTMVVSYCIHYHN